MSGTRRPPDGAGPAETRGDPAGPDAAIPSVYEDAALYDLVLGGLDFDLAFWLDVGRGAGGPVLEIGCGTGRVLLPLLEAGVDADGVDLFPAMLERARAKAAAKGLKPRLVAGDMRDFTMPRRYARVICPFNAFAHADGAEPQIATLRCAREHLDAGGAFVLHMSLPSPAYWLEPDGDPVLEVETRDPATGNTVQLWDTRFKDPVTQRQRSRNEIRTLAPDGRPIATRRTASVQRWVYPAELELLFRIAGFHRWELFGGFGREPLERPDQPLVAWAWKA
jgi:SAM-dependent methyltransferase